MKVRGRKKKGRERGRKGGEGRVGGVYRWSVGRDEGRVEGGEEKVWISTCIINKYVLHVCTTLVYTGNYTCPLLSITPSHHCPLLPITVPSFLSLSPLPHHCPLLPITVPSFLSLSQSSHHCPPPSYLYCSSLCPLRPLLPITVPYPTSPTGVACCFISDLAKPWRGL